MNQDEQDNAPEEKQDVPPVQPPDDEQEAPREDAPEGDGSEGAPAFFSEEATPLLFGPGRFSESFSSADAPFGSFDQQAGPGAGLSGGELFQMPPPAQAPISFSPPTAPRLPDDDPQVDEPVPDVHYPFGITDPYFPQQWGLHNTEHAGVDVNVVEVWEEFTGEGVTVGVIDAGLEADTPDLIANYLSEHAYDAYTNTTDNSAVWPEDSHGTIVSGTIAAARNGVGVVGVAHEADFSLVRLDFSNQSGWGAMEANALNHSDYADVINMSYNSSGFSYEADAHAAINDLATNGRGGLGTILINSSGNSRHLDKLYTYEDKGFSPNVISVGSMESDGTYSFYSTPGASLFVIAPGRDIYTTDPDEANGYGPVSGTSLSAPMVTGVCALMLEANPDLGYRDVMSVLSMTSRKLDTAVSDATKPWDWQFNGAANWNGGGLHVSHDYGFGLVDAHAAVRLAESWDQGPSTAANQETLFASASPGLVADGTSASSSITIASSFDVEYAAVKVTMPDSVASETTLVLESPFGTQSWLLDQSPASWSDSFAYTFGSSDSYAFGSTQCRGEDALGDWTLTVIDADGGETQTLSDWTLGLYGDTPDDNDLYVFTDEYSTVAAMDGSRTTLADTGGTDTVNASAVTTDSRIDLRENAISSINSTDLTISAGTVIENAHGGDGDDILIGNGADNELFGWRGDDSLSGGAGSDWLFGGTGTDTLLGGADSDLFGYGDASQGNDRIMDFSHAEDGFTFDFSQFGQSSAGALDAGSFFTDFTAVDVSDDCFIFDDGILWYDTDGTGSESAQCIAEVAGDDVFADDIAFV